jgi:hypothetical protein
VINHARTLLLNKRAADVASVSGCYAVPAGFMPVDMPNVLREARGLLIPSGLHVSAEVYLVDVLMQLLHAPELEPLTLTWDSRVTYSGRHTDLADMAEPQVTVNFASQASCDMTPRYRYLAGTYAAPLALAGEHSWRVERVDDYTVRITPSRGQPKDHTVLTMTTAARTAHFSLVPNYLAGYLETPSSAVTAGFSLVYETFLAPHYNVGARLTGIRQWLGRSGNYQELFRGADEDETMAELQGIWGIASEAPLRLGAILLALIHRLNSSWEASS